MSVIGAALERGADPCLAGARGPGVMAAEPHRHALDSLAAGGGGEAEAGPLAGMRAMRRDCQPQRLERWRRWWWWFRCGESPVSAEARPDRIRRDDPEVIRRPRRQPRDRRRHRLGRIARPGTQ